MHVMSYIHDIHDVHVDVLHYANMHVMHLRMHVVHMDVHMHIHKHVVCMYIMHVMHYYT